jgi:class 3 adenylate cyclase
VAKRIMAQAESGQVLVTGTVKDLVAGSGIKFPDIGSQELKSLSGEWKLFVAET